MRELKDLEYQRGMVMRRNKSKKEDKDGNQS